MGAMPAEGIYLALARIGTIYYFLHFIVVLPVVGLFEKTDPVPMSISTPVLSAGAEPALPRRIMIRFNFKRLIIVILSTLIFIKPLYSAETIDPIKVNWSFKELTGKFDRASLQRGFQVYKEVYVHLVIRCNI